jgi:branched-chain amino acid transport system substrate-binding protein
LAAGLTTVALVSSSCGLQISHQQALDAIQPTVSIVAGQPADGSGTGGADVSAAPSNGATSSGAGVTIPGAGTSPGATLSQGTGRPTGSQSSVAQGTGNQGPGNGGGAVVGRTCTGTESTLTIGTVGEQSGIFAPFLVPGVQAVQAWVASVNAHGGVNCHPIKYIVKDDGGDPSTAQSEVQELVEQNHIVAMVYMDAPIAGNASVSYLSSHGIPVIGSEGGSDWFYTKPNYFPQITTGVTALGALIGAIAKIGAKSGKHTLGVLSCLEAALCSSLYGVAPGLASANHVTLAYRGQASLTQPSFTAACQAAQSAHVDMFVVGMDTNSIERLLANCDTINYHPLYITGGPLVAPALIADKAAEGFYVASYSDLYNDTANPQIKALVSTLAQYAPGIPPSIDATAGWASAQLFEYALEHASAATPAGIIAALDKVKNNDLDGLTVPLTFTAGANPPRTTCYWVGQVSKGTVIAPAGFAGRTCSG